MNFLSVDLGSSPVDHDDAAVEESRPLNFGEGENNLRRPSPWRKDAACHGNSGTAKPTTTTNGSYGSTILKQQAHADHNREASTASLSTMTPGVLTTSSSNSDGGGSDSQRINGVGDGENEKGVVVIEGRNVCISIDGGGSSSESSCPSDYNGDGDNGGKSGHCPYKSRHSKLRDTFGRSLGDVIHRILCYIEESVFTEANGRVVVSFVIWYVSYMLMGLVGGTVAYMHFPRSDLPYPHALPDYGYDVIPYWCPAIPHAPHGNVQSVVLLFLYGLVLGGVTLRWSPWVKWRAPWIFRFLGGKGIGSERQVWGGDGRLIFQRLLHLNSLLFLTRTTTVCVTGLPQPNPKCVNEQHHPVTYRNALQFVMGRGFPPHACGDLIYSGHVGCTLICMIVLTKHGYLRNLAVRAFVWAVAALGIYCTVSCRSHYTVDVVLAFYMSYLLGEWYFVRAEGLVEGGWAARLIRRLEVKLPDAVLEEEEEEKNRMRFLS